MERGKLSVITIVIAVLALLVGGLSLAQQRGLASEVSATEARTSIVEQVLQETHGLDLDVVLSAASEGSLTWYSAASLEASDAQAEDFMSEYPFIDVTIFRQGSGPLAERFVADAQRGDVVADVLLYSDPGGFQEFVEQGMIDEFVPTSTELLDPALRVLEPHGYPHQIVTMTLTYNTNRITPEQERILHEKGFEAMGDPAFRGEVAIIDPAIAGSTYNLWYILIQEWGEERVRALLEAIAENDPVFYESNTPSSVAIGAGEHTLLANAEAFGIDQIEAGAPVKMLWPDPMPAYFGIIGVAANSPNPNAARLFVEWMMSERGQRRWMNNYTIFSPHPNVSDNRPHIHTDWYEELEDKPTLEGRTYIEDFDQHDAYRDTLIEMFDEIFG